MSDKRKLLINGIGKSYGGEVHTAKIEGMGKIEGDLSCHDFQINGTGEVQGSLKAVTVSINGIGGIEGGLQADSINLEGKLKVDGPLTCEQIRMNGIATVKGSCEAELFEAHGKMDIGLLNAGSIKLTLQGSSHINEIGGGDIQIRKQPGSTISKWLKSIPGPFGNKLSAEVIEGDNIYLEHTTADVVRGETVKIGPGCTIGSIEYKISLDTHSSSTVIKQERR